MEIYVKLSDDMSEREILAHVEQELGRVRAHLEASRKEAKSEALAQVKEALKQSKLELHD